MSTKFDKNKTYQFGVLTVKSEQSNGYPIYARNPAPVAPSGALLNEMGIKTFEEYLKLNPHGYSSKKIITVSEVGEGNELTVIGKGNPLQKVIKNVETGEKTLSDPGNSTVNNYNRQSGSSRVIIKTLENQIEYYQSELSNAGARIQQLQDKLITLEQEKALLNADLKQMTFEKGMYKELAEDQENKPQKGGGLNDFMMTPVGQGLAGLALQLGTSIAQTKLGGAMSDGPPDTNQNHDGESTQPGQFSEKPL